VKRICLFAGFDPEGIIDDYVIHYLKELSEYADIHYLADCVIKPKELKKIEPYTKTAAAYRHEKYDFGSWSELINTIGWAEIQKYDELILANDSQYLVGNIYKFITEMENRNLDFWSGLAVCEEYIGGRTPLEQFISEENILETDFTFVSSFMAFSEKLLFEPFIQNFFSNIVRERDRLTVSNKYEIGLSNILIRHKVNFGVFLDDIYSQSSIYKNTALHFLTLGYPFIKVKIFVNQFYPIISPLNRFNVIKFYNPDLDIGPITRHIQRIRKLYNHESDILSSIKKLSLSQIIRALFKFIYEISPKFLSRYFKELIDKYDIYNFETKFSKSKFDYYSKFLTTIPKQRNLARQLEGKKKLIIFFNVARDIVSGGMLSINRFAKKTRGIPSLSDFQVIISGVPLFNPPIDYSYFEPVSPQIKFSRIVEHCQPDELLIHLPEVLARTFFENLSEREKEWIVKIPKLQINILNQNAKIMPQRTMIRNVLNCLTENITITTAHSTSCTQQLSNEYSAPVHQLTPFLPEFLQVDFEEKRKVILVSNDNKLFDAIKVTKEDIVTKLEKDLPEFKIIEIENVSLEEYKNLIAYSLFTISFGEGFDGYFLEPLLSKSLSFAVFNPFYFPSEFLNSELIYESWEDLYNNIVTDIKMYTKNQEAYEFTSEKNRKLVIKYISNTKSLKELENFYNKEYDFVPRPITYHLFDEYKTKLQNAPDFKFFGEPTKDELILTPDDKVYINMRGDFYKVLYEVYIQNLYDFEFEEDFVFIDIGFHAGTASLNLISKNEHLKHIFGFEAMLPTYQIALKNIKDNHVENIITLLPLGLSNSFDFKKIPYIPDWASNMSINLKNITYDMFSSSEMKDGIRYIEAEIVPANTEMKQIIEHTSHKIMVKCDALGSELNIIENLDEYDLLKKIDLMIIKSYDKSHQPIIEHLQLNSFIIEDTLIDKINKVHKILAKKKQ